MKFEIIWHTTNGGRIVREADDYVGLTLELKKLFDEEDAPQVIVKAKHRVIEDVKP